MWYQQFCGCGATSISDGIINLKSTKFQSRDEKRAKNYIFTNNWDKVISVYHLWGFSAGEIKHGHWRGLFLLLWGEKYRNKLIILAMIRKWITKLIIIRRFYAHLSITFPPICQIETITWWDSLMVARKSEFPYILVAMTLGTQLLFCLNYWRKRKRWET